MQESGQNPGAPSGKAPKSRPGGIPFIDLKNHPPILPLSSFPKKIAVEYNILPLEEEPDGTLVIAVPRGTDFHLQDELRFALGRPFRTVFAQPELIEERTRALYGSQAVARKPKAEAVGAIDEETDELTDADATSIFRKMLSEAVRARASDIHIEAMEERTRVRLRIDGVLHDVNTLPKGVLGPLVSHVKVAAGLDIAEKRLPQDGRIEYRGDIDLRVSILPTNHGETAVLRLLERGLSAFDLSQLGLSPWHQETLDKILEVQDGFTVVTGPTGSGKSTSLYAFLRELADPAVKIITVEDPVEYITEGFIQCPVDSKHGTDFDTALRAILRHDPDIVLLGEIRDKETARTALQAALTGHQVFSTLHTNDAPSAVGRLLNLGAEPFLVNAALVAVIAQRLVRKICDGCRTEYQPKEYELRRIEELGLERPDHLIHGAGCDTCYGSGYKGRMGIFEIITVNSEIQDLILHRRPAGEIREAARRGEMKGMAHDGFWKVCQGRTTTEEILRVVA